MDASSTKKNIKQISQISKTSLLHALDSAKKTREKVRKNIKNGTLPKIPKEIDEFLSEDVARYKV